jgi:hypothetical protein
MGPQPQGGPSNLIDSIGIPIECLRTAGGRGAASAESFLEAGYAVIFLNRTRSMQPFERQVPTLPATLLPGGRLRGDLFESNTVDAAVRAPGANPTRNPAR